MKLLSRTWIMGLAFGVICSAAFAQANWPTRPIKLLVPYGPGSSPDVIARIISEKLATRLGQPVIIDNRVGAGGNTGTGAVAKAAGDGYTFVISTNGPLVYNTVLYKKLNYDPFTELRPVILAGGQSNVCAVRSDSGINTLTDLINAMRSKPGQFNFSSTGIGSLSQLGVELLKVKTDTFAVHIPYVSSPLAIMAILQGDVQFACVPAVAVLPQVKSGQLNALAVGSAKRVPSLPDIPTISESGVPGYEAYSWVGMVAPAKTPKDIVNRLNREIVDILKQKDVSEKLNQQGALPVGDSPEQFAAYIKVEIEKWGAVVRAANIKAD